MNRQVRASRVARLKLSRLSRRLRNAPPATLTYRLEMFCPLPTTCSFESWDLAREGRRG